jgi:hypothetical protein
MAQDQGHARLHLVQALIPVKPSSPILSMTTHCHFVNGIETMSHSCDYFFLFLLGGLSFEGI